MALTSHAEQVHSFGGVMFTTGTNLTSDKLRCCPQSNQIAEMSSLTDLFIKVEIVYTMCPIHRDTPSSISWSQACSQLLLRIVVANKNGIMDEYDQIPCTAGDEMIKLW